jgi:hypothetical protein
LRGVAEQTIEKMDAFFFFDERKIRKRGGKVPELIILL